MLDEIVPFEEGENEVHDLNVITESMLVIVGLVISSIYVKEEVVIVRIVDKVATKIAIKAAEMATVEIRIVVAKNSIVRIHGNHD